MKLKFKIIFAISIILTISSWLIAAFYWDLLPSVIPTHFGISGMADGWMDKTFFSVFLLPMVQIAMVALFVFVYYKPQYSNVPSTIWLMALDKKQKDEAYDLVRTMQSGMVLVISVLFTYLVYNMNVIAMDKKMGLSNVFIFSIIGLMLVWVIFWTVRIYRTTKKMILNK